MGSMNQATPLRGLLQARSDATSLRSVAYYERERRLGRSLALPRRDQVAWPRVHPPHPAPSPTKGEGREAKVITKRWGNAGQPGG